MWIAPFNPGGADPNQGYSGPVNKYVNPATGDIQSPASGHTAGFEITNAAGNSTFMAPSGNQSGWDAWKGYYNMLGEDMATQRAGYEGLENDIKAWQAWYDTKHGRTPVVDIPNVPRPIDNTPPPPVNNTPPPVNNTPPPVINAPPPGKGGAPPPPPPGKGGSGKGGTPMPSQPRPMPGFPNIPAAKPRSFTPTNPFGGGFNWTNPPAPPTDNTWSGIQLEGGPPSWMEAPGPWNPYQRVAFFPGYVPPEVSGYQVPDPQSWLDGYTPPPSSPNVPSPQPVPPPATPPGETPYIPPGEGGRGRPVDPNRPIVRPHRTGGVF